jgi:integrase
MAAAWIEREWSREADAKKRRTGMSKRSQTSEAELRAEGFKVIGYYIGHREPGTGLKRYERRSTFELARERKTELDRQLQSGEYTAKAIRQEKVESFVERMLASDHDLAPSTRAGYRDTWENHVKKRLGHRPIGSVSARELQAFVDQLIADGIGNGTLTTIRQLLAKTFNLAFHEGAIPRPLTSRLRLPKYRRKKLSRETLQGWADAIKPLASSIEPRYQLAVYLAALLGLRAGEIGGLRVQDVDLERRQITIRQAVRTVDGVPEIADTKTEAGERTIAVPVHLMDAIAAYTREFPPADDGRIFTAAQGGLVSHLTLNKALQKAIVATSSPSMRFHDLRHLAASTMIAVGINPNVVKERLGHSTLAITMDRYGHLFPEQDRDAADKLEGYVLSKGLLSVITVPQLAEVSEA